MTNSTVVTTEITTDTSITKAEAITMDNINKQSVINMMSADLYRKGMSPQMSLLVATAWVGSVDYIEDADMFFEVFMDGLQLVKITAYDCDMQPEEIDGGFIMSILAGGKYIVHTPDGDDWMIGPRFGKIVGNDQPSYMPVLAEEGVTRRFDYAPIQYSNLFKEAIHALESTEFNVDQDMLSLALQVNAKMGQDFDKEGYVVSGCAKMDPNGSYVAEFKGDKRGRMYQAACHGPNGQASDRSRALMNLVGVPTDYDSAMALAHIKAEMGDMVKAKDPKQRAQLVRSAMNSPVEFIIEHLLINEDVDQEDLVNKPWSFVKAAKLLVALTRGEKPYIGMAFGKDAKCSGPQLGSLMVGNAQLAAACGFTLEEMDDAYELCIAALEKAGFHGLTRALIKKPYMGVFYGQGWRAFMGGEDMPKELFHIIHLGQVEPMEDRAKLFHKVVEGSFGSNMCAVRASIKAFNHNDRVTHLMPDGLEVDMDYRVNVNMMGEEIGFDVEGTNVKVTNNMETYSFKKLSFRTDHIHFGDLARNGFVNMIQATDALLARLIVVNLKRLGAKHIICVHDCFRVNVTEMHLLDQAIMESYQALFGGEWNKRTQDLPFGTDILGMYFDGANEATSEDNQVPRMSQFLTNGKRRMPKIQGLTLSNMISKLGNPCYYFDK